MMDYTLVNYRLTDSERLLNSLELEVAKDIAEQQSADMEAIIARYRQRFRDLPENNGEDT
ncbi:MAG: hypothetical protein F6K10_02515 [Moorea sp. SIO2B7]|nr:hypothetical protein [Moorena sp. SIO2B7]